MHCRGAHRTVEYKGDIKANYVCSLKCKLLIEMQYLNTTEFLCFMIV